MCKISFTLAYTVTLYSHVENRKFKSKRVVDFVMSQGKYFCVKPEDFKDYFWLLLAASSHKPKRIIW